MASKMVLRRQTGHICTECKESFRAKEMLLEHYEQCHPNISVETADGNNLIENNGSKSEDVLENLKSEQLDETQQPGNVENTQSEHIMPEIKIEITEEELGGEEVIVENAHVNQTGFDDGICAFEVIEEIVDGNEIGDKNLQEVILGADNSSEQDANGKRIVRKRKNSNIKDPKTPSNNCNTQSVYSLCLAAEIASSMEQVQAAQSLLGMSQKEIEEGAEGGNEKMAALLRKKVAETGGKDKLDKSKQVFVEVNSEKKEGVQKVVTTPANVSNINLASKISFLQSLNKRIISGQKHSEGNLSSLITSPLNTIKTEGVKKSNDMNITFGGNRYLIDQGMVEKSKNSIVIYEDQRQIHFPVSNKNLHNNSFNNNNNNRVIINNSRPGRLKNIPLNNMQGEMIPVTQEIEVVTDFIKVEADNNYSFNNTTNNNNNNDSYVIQLVQNNNNNRNNIQPNQPNYKSSVDASLSNLGLPVNSRNQQLNEVKDGKIYMCGLCNKVYNDCELLKTHVEKHSGLEKQANKSMKDDKFTDDSDDSTSQSSSPTRHQCRECGEKFSRLAFLKKHAKAEHGQLKAYVCGACNKSFPFACGLKLHALTHGAERRYSCQFCGRRFKHASNLQKHVKVVHVNTCKCRTVECVCGKRDPSSFKIDHACHICGRVCESSKHLEIHYRSHTGEKPEVCQICGKSFQHKSNLQKHQLKHTGIRPYQCPHCQRSFFVKHSYLGHLRLHTHDSPYTCETCGKSFISKNGLQVHSILHQDRMPFCCGQCGKEFAQLGNLNKHLSLHTGDKPYPCSYCDKKFVDTSALKRHMVIHTKERIYTCPDCGKSFQHFSTLRSHMTTHRFDDQQQQQTQNSPEKRMCELCGKSFNSQAAFLSHVRQHRQDQQTTSGNNNNIYYGNNINKNVVVDKGFKRFKPDDTYNNNNIVNNIPNKRQVVVNSGANSSGNNANNNENEEIEYIVYYS